MNSWIKSNYHLVVLVVAVIALVVSSVALILDHRSYGEKFSAVGESTPSTTQPDEAASSFISKGADRMEHPVTWNSRRDGASLLVSRLYLLKNGTLVDPLEQSEPLYPPVPNKWLFEKGLDYTDVKILERDPKHKGFTVLEEFLAGTDPNNSSQIPPLHTKLRYSADDILKNSYVLEFVGVEEIDGRKEFQLRPFDPLPNPANKNKPDRNTRSVALGASIPGADFLKVAEFREKKKVINDTEYDVSELVLENNATGSRHTIIKKHSSREYQRAPIEVIESVQLHYQLTGAPEEIIPVTRGKQFTLSSLDKSHHETYKFHRISNEGILLEKNGVSYTIKPSQPARTPESSGITNSVPPPNAP